ncbi:MAG: hypothetical protein GQ565_11165 [Candidatus Aegiribacteria sp.]|nr:hypothetical protein [Candidatus Aegiribacteria sp.]
MTKSLVIGFVFLILCAFPSMAAPPVFGSISYIQCGGDSIDVGFFSDPVFVDFDGDGLKDLIVGQYFDENVENYGKMRFYQNVGTSTDPSFASWIYIQADGSDIQCSAG